MGQIKCTLSQGVVVRSQKPGATRNTNFWLGDFWLGDCPFYLRLFTPTNLVLLGVSLPTIVCWWIDYWCPWKIEFSIKNSIQTRIPHPQLASGGFFGSCAEYKVIFYTLPSEKGCPMPNSQLPLIPRGNPEFPIKKKIRAVTLDALRNVGSKMYVFRESL